MLILYSHILIQLRDTTKRIKSARKREMDYKESTVTIWVAGRQTRTIYLMAQYANTDAVHLHPAVRKKSQEIFSFI